MNYTVLKKQRGLPLGKQLRIAVFSDLHFGSNDFNEKTFTKTMEYYYPRCDSMLFLGDVFDAIVAKDKRSQPSTSKFAEQDAQLNYEVDYAFEMLKPYADKIDLITMGNHEFSVLKYSSINLVSWLVNKLNTETGSKIEWAGYNGFIHYKFNVASKKNVDYTIFFSHGSGGSAPVTKGIIDIARVKTDFVFDAFFCGHKHNKIFVTDRYLTLNSNGKLTENIRVSAQVGNFQNKISEGRTVGFAETHNFPPSANGGALLTLETLLAGNDYYISPNLSIKEFK